jgi:hypothetical protein
MAMYMFKCQNKACKDKDNFVELPESDAKSIKYFLYCDSCGKVVKSEGKVVLDNRGNTWLPCILYTGIEGVMTSGPIFDDKYGYLWGVPGGNALSEEEFMKQYGINPRIEWCNRISLANPISKEICTQKKKKIKPVEYSTRGSVPCPKPNLSWSEL